MIVLLLETPEVSIEVMEDGSWEVWTDWNQVSHVISKEDVRGLLDKLHKHNAGKEEEVYE